MAHKEEKHSDAEMHEHEDHVHEDEHEHEKHEVTETPAEHDNEGTDSPEEKGEADEPVETDDHTESHAEKVKSHGFATFWATKKGKVTVIVAAVVVLLGILFSIPATRYAMAGLVIKKDLTLQAVDSKTGKPVSAAQLIVNGQTVKTDANGKVTVHNIPVGAWKVSAKKTYYQDASATGTLPIFASADMSKVAMVATGRQVPLTITNTITGKPVADVEVTAGASAVTTASDGTATIVLPANVATVAATFKSKNYNTTDATITVTEQKDAKNNFTVTPAGVVYFLSKRTGVINVMKSNLDGTDQSVVVTGTGKEDNGQTLLIASRDWAYLTLYAKRDSDTPKLYLVNTATGKLSVMDEGAKVTFNAVGWSGHTFIYKVYRTDVQDWQQKQSSIKSFNAESSAIATLDDSDATGTNGPTSAHEYYDTVFILKDEIVFGKAWGRNSFGNVTGKKNQIISVKADGSAKHVIKDFAAQDYNDIESRIASPSEIYFKVAFINTSEYYEYEDGKIATTTAVNDNNFYDASYATYLVSPNDKYTFWYESRDGKKVAFVGDIDGKDGKQVLSDDNYIPYGWYSDDYLLFSKSGSELYVLPRDISQNLTPIKITDYHKPVSGLPGYGYGYGGSF